MLSPLSRSTPSIPRHQPQSLPTPELPDGDSFETRSFDGRFNHQGNPNFNVVGRAYLRKAPAAYADGVSAPSGSDRPGPREISNSVLAATGETPDAFHWSGLLWGWGQFIDHDLTNQATSKKSYHTIPVPAGDPWFDPQATGHAFIPYKPTHPTPGTGKTTPLEPWNQNTGWLDASMVYGSNRNRANALRSHQGGKLLTSEGNNLPYNTMGLKNDNDVHAPEESLLVAGDVRCNENPLLLSLHTIFMREHNRLCDELARKHPGWDDEKLYGEARRRVGALVQSITYREYLPNLLGPTRMPRYEGYKPDTDPRVTLEFVTAGFRLGHSQLSGTIFRNEPDTDMIAQGDATLRDTYFNPARTLQEGGIAAVLRGAADYVQQATDLELSDDVRCFLFGPPGAGGLDLGAINIARGREQGLPDFNSVRAAYGMQPLADFEELTDKPETAARLRTLYGSIDKLDPWVGMLAEKPDEGSVVGRTVRHIIVDQFTRLRDGDRFYFEHDPALRDELDTIKSTTLSAVIARNLGEEFQPYAFHGKEVTRD